MALSAQRAARMAATRIKRRLPRTHRVVLFGSWAKGNAVQTSDVDLGIVGPRAIPLILIHQMKEDLETLPTLRKIEVVDLQRASKTFKKNILKYAKPL